MDSDRKSTVSSFYGGRKGSLDALNADFASPSHHDSQPTGRGRDDASSFFNPDRASRNLDGMNGERFGTAGYNRGSFFHAGREEPLKGGRDEETPASPGNDAWDVYADFNNAGPRYSNAFGQGNGYQALETPPAKGEDGASSLGPVELVTVPALGPEWQRSEMREMTKAGRREKKAEGRQRSWKAFNRGERGLCGKWFTRRTLVFVLFGLVAAIVLVLAFTIPRVPGFSFNNDHPLANATGDWATAIPSQFSRAPANFSFPAFADLQLDTGANFLPLTFKHLYASVYDVDTGRLVGTGDLGHKTLPAKSFPDILIPLNFTYTATNDSDQTWANWYNACKNSALYVDGNRPALQFRLVLDMDIAGLPSKHETTTQINDANCPIELSQNAA